jgi:hypothetical protein
MRLVNTLRLLRFNSPHIARDCAYLELPVKLSNPLPGSKYMQSGWITFYEAVGAFITYGVLDSFVLQPRRWMAQHGEEWRAYNAGAFHPQVSAPGRNNIRTVVRVADEMMSDGGKRAIRINNGHGGIVVHEFAKDGLCSGRGPYYIRLRACIWQSTGRRHLVETVRHPTSVQTSNPSGGWTREEGRRILEFNTNKYPPLSLKQFVEKRSRYRSEDKSPDLARSHRRPNATI